MSTFLQLCQSLRSDLGIEGSGPTSVVNQSGMMARIVSWVSMADVWIQNKYQNWNFLHKTATLQTNNSVNEVYKPADLGLWDTSSLYCNDKKMQQISYSTWVQTYRTDTTTGEPFGFAVAPNGNIKIIPTPDAEYTIYAEYWKKATKMKENSDTSPIPEQYEQAILAKAAVYFAIQEEVPNLQNSSNQELYEIMSIMESSQLPGGCGFTTLGNSIGATIE